MMVSECAGNALEIAFILGREPGPVAGIGTASAAAPAERRCIQHCCHKFFIARRQFAFPRADATRGSTRPPRSGCRSPMLRGDVDHTSREGSKQRFFNLDPARGYRVPEQPICMEMNRASRRGALQCAPSGIIAPLSGAEISPAQQSNWTDELSKWEKDETGVQDAAALKTTIIHHPLHTTTVPSRHSEEGGARTQRPAARPSMPLSNGSMQTKASDSLSCLMAPATHSCTSRRCKPPGTTWSSLKPR